jgi:16S rRNA (guanine1207-N2)-methyltransferase
VYAASQIIARNLDQLENSGSTLWINPERDDCWRSLRTRCTALSLLSQDYGTFVFLQHTGADVRFAAFPPLEKGRYDRIILNLPRQKALLGMMLDCAASLLPASGVLWLAGENRAGIKSARKLLDKHFGQVRKLDNARHCGLFEASGRLEHAPFDARAWRDTWQLDCAGRALEIVSYPGVFAHGRLDEGTALLLDTLANMQLRGEVLDFACGAGVIGTFVARQHADTRVTLLDTNALALLSCQETLAANRVNAAVLAADGLGDVAGQFDLIVTNPPIHAGVSTDNGLGMRLLDRVHERLHSGGRLILVANRHLPYESWLSTRFSSHGQLAVNENFKVLTAKK